MADYGTLDYCGIDALAYDEAEMASRAWTWGRWVLRAIGACVCGAVLRRSAVRTKSIEVLASSTSSLTKPAVIFASAAATY
jgi:hypothetical protein